MADDADEQRGPPEPHTSGSVRSRGCHGSDRERELLAGHQLTLLRSVRDKLAVTAQHKVDVARHTLDRAPAVADVALRQADSVLVALRRAVHLFEQEQTHRAATTDRADG